jgi:hypothetical protein
MLYNSKREGEGGSLKTAVKESLVNRTFKEKRRQDIRSETARDSKQGIQSEALTEYSMKDKGIFHCHAR